MTGGRCRLGLSSFGLNYQAFARVVLDRAQHYWHWKPFCFGRFWIKVHRASALAARGDGDAAEDVHRRMLPAGVKGNSD